MIVFELSMPNRGSWNGEWSQYGSLFVRTLRERDVPKECWGKSFCYSWEDGWTACVTVTRMTASEARRLEQKSNGFCGYDWMIRSIIKHGDIRREVIAMKKMTADEAYAKHIEMWTAMQKELGDNPTYSNREDFKRAWVRKRGETVCNSCYLCQYNLETGNIHCGKNCLVDWGGGCLIGKTSYATSPISEILALPRKEENDGRLISRQAAIDAVRSDYEGILDFTSDGHTIADSVEDIINALPSVQPEPTTEIQEILNYLDTTLHPIVSPDNWNVYSELYDMVSSLSSAQPERKKGEWIPQNHNKTNGMISTAVYYYPKCSVCGHCANYTNFCPNCGADMRGEQDG